MRQAVLFALALLVPAGARAQDVANGREAYAACAACHELTPASTTAGPSLLGVAGRRAGSLQDFRYSRAMAASGIVWTAETLDAYLADPPNALPGNRMAFSGIQDAALRRDIVAYLLTLR
ncbi:MAG: c-type cytochrome [Acetobacteraceae bacterium]|nr:c-type cytochrome [Acetobacteraceae bacterium]MCX7684792.1 c-type cytochrome [Acetobacteraceae bacterium]MDW8398775.1 c-type cytochrome [Acetobacteraceae bacterium]